MHANCAHAATYVPPPMRVREGDLKTCARGGVVRTRRERSPLRDLGSPQSERAPKRRLVVSGESSPKAAAAAAAVPEGGPAWTLATAPPQKRFKWEFYFAQMSAEQRAQMRMDDVGTYSVTDMRSADATSRLICEQLGVSAEQARAQVRVVDGCACVGGNAISFGKHFASTTAVEFSASRCDMLRHNLDVLGLGRSVQVVNADFVRMATSRSVGRSDAVFLDPPWGGEGYRAQKSIDISMGGMALSEICAALSGCTKLVVMKLPTNFNMPPFRAAVRRFAEIVVETRRIRKTLVLVLRYHQPPASSARAGTGAVTGARPTHAPEAARAGAAATPAEAADGRDLARRELPAGWALHKSRSQAGLCYFSNALTKEQLWQASERPFGWGYCWDRRGRKLFVDVFAQQQGEASAATASSRDEQPRQDPAGEAKRHTAAA